MRTPSESHTDRLKAIRSKYNGSSECRTRVSSQYVPPQSPDIGKLSYINKRTGTEERINRSEIHMKNLLVENSSPGNIYLRRASKDKDVERIREEYAASRKKVIDQFTRDTLKHSSGAIRDFPKDFKDYRPASAAGGGRDYDYNDYGHGVDCRKDGLRDVQREIYQGRSYAMPKPSITHHKEFTTEYPRALEKAQEFTNGYSLKTPETQIHTRNFEYTRQFGRQYNVEPSTLDNRLSFGRESPDKTAERYSALSKYIGNSSPIKRVQDMASDLSLSKCAKYDYEFERENQVQNNPIGIHGLSSKNYLESPTKQRHAWDSIEIDRLQSRIHSVYQDKKFR